MRRVGISGKLMALAKIGSILGYIAPFFVERFLEHAPASADRASLMRSVGLEPSSPPTPDAMVSDSDFFDMLEKIAATGDEGRTIAITVGAGMKCDDYGAFGLAFKSAVTLLSSFHRVERFGKVVTSIANYRVVPEDHSFFMEVHRSPDQRLGLHMTKELAVAAATALCREVKRNPFSPIAISFAHAPPLNPASFESYFGCPVSFDASRDGLEISNEDCEAPNRLGDAKTSEFFETHLEKELAALSEDAGLAQRVRIQVSSSLSEGVPVISDVANRLGMSERSLQRRLSEQGYVYQGIVDDARRELSERLLRSSEYSLTEIAFLTGYSEQSTFTKAFKRWNGQTPRSFRLGVQSKQL